MKRVCPGQDAGAKKGAAFPFLYLGCRTVNWQESVFGPLLAHTMENVQVRHLAEHYDLSQDSRLAHAIIKHTNQVLDAEEKRRQVLRVRPGELLLRTRRGPLILPLRTPEDVCSVVAGERWDVVRRDILDRCAAKYRELFPEAPPAAVARFLRSIWQGRVPRGTLPSPFHGPRQQRPLGVNLSDGKPLPELDADRGRLRLDRHSPHPGHLPETPQATDPLSEYPGWHPPAVQEPLILDLMALRARFCPRVTMLATGQMPLVAMHVNAGRTLWQPSRYQPMAPVMVSFLADDEAYKLRHSPQAPTRSSSNSMGGAWLGF